MDARRSKSGHVLVGSVLVLATMGTMSCPVQAPEDESAQDRQDPQPSLSSLPVEIGHPILREPVDDEGLLEARMRATALRIEAGDLSMMGEVYVPTPPVVTVPQDLQIASEVFGEPEDDLSDSELENCSSFPYLVEREGSAVVFRDGRPLYNSFNWWSLGSSMPSTGPLARPLECEFNRPIVTIVGADTAGLAARGYKYVTDWGATSAGSPNSMPGIRFTARRHAFTPDGPESDPRFENLTVIGSDGQRRSRRVLVNRGYPPDDIVLPASVQRPSLFLDFEIPQRAVGLEYGFLQVPGVREDRPHTDDIWLIAYDGSGNPIRYGSPQRTLESNARQIVTFQSLLDVDRVTQRIGVVDEEARIRSVELRFGQFDDQDASRGMTVEPQVVYRVWHEPLPHAAVKQGSATSQFTPGDLDPDPITIDLPYRCDRAVAFLRGFKSWYGDRRAREVSRIDASIVIPVREPTSVLDGLSSPVVPAVTTFFSTDPGGTIEFAASGGASSGELLTRSVTVFYTVLAWDSTQVDLYTRHDSATARREHATSRASMKMPDSRCPWSASPDCGGLFGAMQHFGFSVWAHWDVQEIDHVWLAVGGPHGSLQGGGWALSGSGLASIGTSAYLPELLWRPLSGEVFWNTLGSFDGDEQDRNIRSFEGTVLAGHNVKSGSLPSWAYTNRSPGRRPNADSFFMNVHDVRASGMIPQIEADVAFLGLETFLFVPDGRIAEMEVEVRGEVYDGNQIDWQMGGGLDTSDNDTESGAMFALPSFGAVVRNDHVAKPRIEVQDVVCESVVGIRRASDRLGLVRNVGTASIVIDELYQNTYLPVDQQFQSFVLWQGNYRPVSQMQASLPIRLDPGDQLLIGARFTPTSPAGFGSDPHRTWLNLLTNSAAQPRVRVPILGFAHVPDPGCAWQVEELDFGAAQTQPLTLSSALFSTGTTPLIVSDIRLEHGDHGFTLRFPPAQLEPELLVVIVDWAGNPSARAQFFEDRLIADTNAGECSLDLLAGGLRGMSRGPYPGGD